MRKLFFKSMLLLCALIVGTSSAWAQSDYSATYTSNVTLPTSGTQAASCKISIGGEDYTGTKLGKNGGGGAASITAPSGTRYIHLHVAAWNGKSTNFTYKVGPGTVQTIDGITSNTGIANTSPFTWGTTAGNSNPNSTNHYKVIDLGSALESATTITFASGSERVVFWGVNTEAAAVAISSIAFSEPKTASVGVGGTTTLTPTVLPANHTEVVDWESDATGVATVNSSGVVTGVAAGIAHITAKAHDNPSTIYDVCTITVTAPVAVTSVSLKSSTTLLLGGTETLEATVLPNDATNKNVSWSSADDTKVSVDENGVITGLALTNGTPVNITVTTEDGGKTAVCAVTVNPIPVSSVSLNKNSATLSIGKTLTLTKTVSPDNATDKTVTWTTSNSNIATVDDGVVTAIAVGTATITVKSNADNTKSATCSITVNDGAIELTPGEEIVFNNFSGAGTGGYKTQDCELEASDGNTYQWSENRAYSNSGWQLEASDGRVTSPSIKTSYGFVVTATMSNNTVTISDGTNEGSNTLTSTKTNTSITISSTSKYAKISSISITARKPSRSVTFPDGNQTITVGGSTITKTATVSPDGTATYSSSNTAVATVNATTGEVTAVKGGTAVITATVAADDDYEKSTGSYTVTVNKGATTLAFAHAEETVELVDGAATFTATATPADASRTITYSTEDEITVNSSTGAVTLAATGDFVIKANANTTDKYLAPSEASYTLHVVDNRKPVVSEASVALVLQNDNDLSNVAMENAGDISAEYTKAAGFEGAEVVTIESSNPDVFYIDGGEYLAAKGGTVTVTVTITSNGNKMFTTVVKNFTVTVINSSKTATEITVTDNEDFYVNGDELNLTYGTPFVLDVDITSGYEGTIGAEFENDQIAELSVSGTTYTITPLAVGSTTFTLSAGETANYAAAPNIALTINVAAPAGSGATPAGDATNIYSNNLLSNSLPTGWSGDGTVWGAEAKYGVVTAKGNISGTYDLITENFDLSGYSDLEITFDHTGNQSFSTPSSACNVYIQEGSNTPEQLTIDTYFAGDDWEYVNAGNIEIDSKYEGKTVHFIFRYTPISGNNGKWEVKNFKIRGVQNPTVNVTLNADGYATFCSEYPLDFSDYETANYSAWQITDVSNSTITFSQITGTIKGGKGILLKGPASEEITIKNAWTSDNELSSNKLVGCLAPTYVGGDARNYALVHVDATNETPAHSEFQNLGSYTGIMPAGKAYLRIPGQGQAPSAFRIVFEENNATDINSIEESDKAVKFIENGQLYIMRNGVVYDAVGRLIRK